MDRWMTWQWIFRLKTDLPLTTSNRNKHLLLQAKLYMGDDSFVEVKPIDITDEGMTRTAFRAMMELRTSGEVIVPNIRYPIVTS